MLLISPLLPGRLKKPVVIKLANVWGGLSGPAIKPLALRMVYQVVQTVKVPVVGIGGIVTGYDALEFLAVGAKAVEVGTANFVNPRVTLQIIDELQNFCQKKQLSRIEDYIGSFRPRREKQKT